MKNFVNKIFFTVSVFLISNLDAALNKTIKIAGTNFNILRLEKNGNSERIVYTAHLNDNNMFSCYVDLKKNRYDAIRYGTPKQDFFYGDDAERYFNILKRMLEGEMSTTS